MEQEGRKEGGDGDEYFLRSQRLQFRRWREEDAPLAIALWGDMRVTALFGGPFSEEEVRQRLVREIASDREHGVQYWPIFTRDSKQHVGCCGLRPRPLDHHAKDDEQGKGKELGKGKGKVLELGVHIRPEFWRQGYAEEAARAVIGLALAEAPGGLGAAALFAGHNPRNEASKALLTKLGFKWTHDELYPPTGLQHPSYLLPAPLPLPE